MTGYPQYLLKSYIRGHLTAKALKKNTVKKTSNQETKKAVSKKKAMSPLIVEF
jgi:hypothetical protein